MVSVVTEQILVPAGVQEVWNLLADTLRMLALDPMIESYEPENGALEEGTLNRVTSRIGPWRARMTTRTETLDSPHRAVFVSVVPRRPVRVRVEDTLSPVSSGTLYTAKLTVEPTRPVGRLLAPLIARFMARSRRQMMRRLAEELKPT